MSICTLYNVEISQSIMVKYVIGKDGGLGLGKVVSLIYNNIRFTSWMKLEEIMKKKSAFIS